MQALPESTIRRAPNIAVASGVRFSLDAGSHAWTRATLA
jgi:hypothetical protein